ncbi:MAG: phytoene dehydrogenase-like oxidoreductase [Bacteroidetes bacterium]|nr:MAG: phytoene dehydrogenase-like oxidoreductase [Bacteroidota bacterium]
MHTDQRYDFVIIGGGLGGLMCAGILSQNNYRVCVLERDKKAGGNLQTFSRNGCLFDTGMHYIGSYDKGQPLYQIFRYLGLVDKFKVQRLDDEGYDVISIGDREFRFSTGYDNFSKNLKQYFPGEESAIDAYIDTIKRVSNQVNTLGIFDDETDKAAYFFSYNESAFDFINNLTQNKLLRAVLAGNNGLYCGNSKKTPVNLLANTNNFYLGSAYRMSGGGHQLANALVSKIEQQGGLVLTGKKVTRLSFEGKRVASAETSAGEAYFADNFISAVHPAVSLDWIEPGKLPKVYTDRIRNIENTIGAFVLYLVVGKGKIRHRNGNLYYSVDEDVWDINRTPGKPWPHGYMLYTTKDGDTGYAESITVVTMLEYNEVRQWENTVTGRRGEDYRRFKQEKMEALTTLILKKLPEIKGNVLHSYAATPLTFRDYTGSVNGSMYGIEKDCNNALKTFISVRTKIPNFYFTGQNINNHGMLGVTIGALITAGNFIDIQSVVQKIRNA